MGLGLRGTGSLNLDELSILKESDLIFVDAYTSIFPENVKEDIEKVTGNTVRFLNREEVESFAFLKNPFKTLSLIVSGDPMSSTTHFAIVEKCREMGFIVDIMENASILTTVPGRTGLSPYRMGPVISIPQIVDNFVPMSVARKIRDNMIWQLHTILLIDLENGKNMDPPKVFHILKALGENILPESFFKMPLFVMERIGWADERVFITTVETLESLENHSPYCTVLPMSPNSNEMASTRALGLNGIMSLETFDYKSLCDRAKILIQSETKEY